MTANSHLIGYARVSTTQQDPRLQLDALNAAGCIRVFTDFASGGRDDRPELARALDYLQPGNVLVVWRLDRLGRSVRHLIDLTAQLQNRAVGLRSLQEAIDTTTAGGRMVFHVLAALAELERELIRERTLAGLAAAQRRGRRGGRPPRMTPAKLRLARRMRADDPPASYAEIARELQLSKTTIARHLSDGRAGTEKERNRS